MLTGHPPRTWARAVFSLAMSEPQLRHLQGVQITPTSRGRAEQHAAVEFGTEVRRGPLGGSGHVSPSSQWTRGPSGGPWSWRFSPGKGCITAPADRETERSAGACVRSSQSESSGTREVSHRVSLSPDSPRQSAGCHTIPSLLKPSIETGEVPKERDAPQRLPPAFEGPLPEQCTRGWRVTCHPRKLCSRHRCRNPLLSADGISVADGSVVVTRGRWRWTWPGGLAV